ncbi:MAG: 4-hydroxybenzoate octaprenyltransferase [Alphaproteobacteria bacterium]
MTSDIQTEKLIFRMTPRAAHPYIKLARLDRPIGTWLLLIPCWWGLALAVPFRTLAPFCGMRPFTVPEIATFASLFAIGAVVMRAAGCVINDIWDRKLDAQVERTRSRPLPSGEVTPRQALVFLTLLLVTGLAVLLQFNKLSIKLGFLSLALVATYPLMKRITWWPQLFLGFTFNWGALLGWTALQGRLPLHIESIPLWLYAGGIFWTLAYDTIYAHQDKEDDATIGIRSTARLFGKHSKIFVGAFFMLAITCFGVAKFFAAPSQMTQLLIALPVAHALWQLHIWKMDDAASCLKVFKMNRDFGFLVLLMLVF